MCTQLCCFCLYSTAQTGPGGVGSSTTNVLWLRANDSVFSDAGTTPAATTNNVQQWNDMSGNGKNASQGTVGTRPNYITNVFNGNPVIRFTSTSQDVLQSFGVSTANVASVWVVGSYSSLPSSNPGLLVAAPAASGVSVAPANKSIGLWVNNGAGTKVWGRGIQSNGTSRDISQITTLSASTAYIVNSIYRTNRMDQYVNHAAAGNNTAHDGTLKSWTEVSIGRQGTESWNGDIAEVVIFNTEVNSTQRLIIDNYLASKYGLTLTSQDLFVFDSPALGNYDFDLAGIGRVGAGNLQSDSRGSGFIRISNPDDLDDNEFMLWANDGGAMQGLETTDVPAGVQARFSGVWRLSEVDASGVSVDVGSVDMDWDLKGLGSITASHLRLLIDSNNNGTFADDNPIAGAVNIGGDTYQFAGVTQLRDSVRFTLGTAVSAQTPLPIELLSFDGMMTDAGYVKLSWKTASETNNDFFTVQKSQESKNWMELERTKGAGNTSQICNYEVMDFEPLEGTSFYRLKQTDFDGGESVSHSISIVNDANPKSDWAVYPNPTDSKITILDNNIDQNSIRIFDSMGVDVTSQVRFTKVTSSKMDADVEKLIPGIYLVLCGRNLTKIEVK